MQKGVNVGSRVLGLSVMNYRGLSPNSVMENSIYLQLGRKVVGRTFNLTLALLIFLFMSVYAYKVSKSKKRKHNMITTF